MILKTQLFIPYHLLLCMCFSYATIKNMQAERRKRIMWPPFNSLKLHTAWRYNYAFCKQVLHELQPTLSFQSLQVHLCIISELRIVRTEQIISITMSQLSSPHCKNCITFTPPRIKITIFEHNSSAAVHQATQY